MKFLLVEDSALYEKIYGVAVVGAKLWTVLLQFVYFIGFFHKLPFCGRLSKTGSPTLGHSSSWAPQAKHLDPEPWQYPGLGNPSLPWGLTAEIRDFFQDA